MDETIGQLLARLRKERGWSQTSVAERLCAAREQLQEQGSGRAADYDGAVTRHEVSRYERGGRIPTDWLESYAVVFDVPLSLLESAVAKTRRARSGQSGEPDMLAGLELGGSTWRRRDAIELAEALSEHAGHVNAATAARIAHTWLLVDPPQLTELEAGPRVGAGMVERVEQRLHDLRRLDDFLTGPDLAETVTAELRATARVLCQASFSEQVGRRLLAATADLAQLAGWICSDLGRHEEAERYYLGGVRAAHAAGDAATAGNLLSSLSYQMANTTDPRQAVLLAQTAVTGASHAPGLVRALLLERLAWAHARTDDADQAERALGAVDDAFGEHRTGEEPPWVYWLDRTEIEVMAGRCFTELRKPLRAQPLLAAAIDRYDKTHLRETALYLTWLADSYTQAGELEAAVDAATRALDLSTGMDSARVTSRIGQVRQRFHGFDHPVVRAFDDRFRSHQAASTTARSRSAVTLEQPV